MKIRIIDINRIKDIALYKDFLKMNIMSVSSISDALRVPVILIDIEETRICLGHEESGPSFNSREKAKEGGSEWLKKKENDSSIFNLFFDVIKEGKKNHRLKQHYTHINDISCCNKFVIQIIRNFQKY